MTNILCLKATTKRKNLLIFYDNIQLQMYNNTDDRQLMRKFKVLILVGIISAFNASNNEKKFLGEKIQKNEQNIETEMMFFFLCYAPCEG